MIKISEVEKSFDGFKALDCLNINVKRGSIYGLVGPNGSGKTTIIKHLTGVLKPDEGTIEINGEPVYENEKIKEIIGFIPDDLYFFATYNLKEMSKFLRGIYPKWNQDRFEKIVTKFGLDSKRKISKFSKGMQKQAAFALTMAQMPEVLVLDEPVDGLDPIVRKIVWNYIIEDVAEREMTVIISSHNLREIEGVCDSVGILEKGKMLIERDLDELKTDIHKVQISFGERKDDVDTENIYEGLNVMFRETRGSVDLLIIKEKQERVEEILRSKNPVLMDMLPLSLEEIFIYEIGGGESEIMENIF